MKLVTPDASELALVATRPVGHGTESMTPRPSQQIDLLFEEPENRIALATAFESLSFAFASGDTDNLFERVLDSAQTAHGTFEAESFAHDLFLHSFIERCLRVSIGRESYKISTAYVHTILSSPPELYATTQFRQRITEELQDPPTLEQFEVCYLAMRRVRDLLSAGGVQPRYERTQRRFDILTAIRDLFRCLERCFETAASGLAQLREYGRQVCSSNAFARLEQLLEYEERLATLDIRVQVGRDGQIRSFVLRQVNENVGNIYYQGAWARLTTRLQLLFRGFRLGREELLVRLTDHIFDSLRSHLVSVFQLIGDMEFYLAGVGLAKLARQQGLAVCLPEFGRPTVPGSHYKALFNPFLVAAGNVVTCADISSSAERPLVVVTGPNSGGKTRLMQALGLSQLLGQGGLWVPAQEAHLPWCSGMFVSLLSEHSAEQAEGRLGMELLRIRKLFERIATGDLVIVDELCSGTNPSEGEEIFCLVVELLAKLQPNLWLTTHFLALAGRLQTSASPAELDFLQVELDPQGQPTYRFVAGVAKTSLASHTAQRLGVTATELNRLVAEAKARGDRRQPIAARARRPLGALHDA